MEPKRELTSVDLAALVRELASYQGAVVDKAYLYGDDLVRLKLRDFDRGRVELLVEVGEVKRAHVAAPEHVPSAPGRPPDFAKMLRNRISGANFVGVEQFGFDRILSFHFEREDGNTTIVAELFGQGNVAVLDENRTVIDSLDTVRLKSRTVAPGATYEFPSSRLDPLALSYEAFVARMEESDTDVVRTLATLLNFGGLYAEEICTRAGVEKALDIADAGEEAYEPLFETIEDLKADLEAGEFDPRVYLEREEPRSSDGASGEPGEPRAGTRVDVTPFPLEEHADLDFEVFETFNGALDDYFTALDLTEDEDAGSERPDFEAQIAKQERIIEQQQGAIEDFEEQADAERRKAELLYANYGLVDEILSTVRAAREEGVPWDDIEKRFAEGADRDIAAAEAVRGIDSAEGTVSVALDDETVELDAGTGVEKNADRLYTEAKRIEKKAEGAREAIANTRAELEAVRERRDAWEATPEDEDDEEAGDEGEDIDWLSKSSIPVREPEEWYDRFRWFHTADGYLVIGGRNADQNEELVAKYLERGDGFFHAQAHGGPVTALKATGPSESARDVDFSDATLGQAAQFAVSYSSVWKDGRFSGDAYMVDPDQVSKTPESGEYLEKGGFAIRGDRTYFEDVAVGVAVGITCEPTTRVIGGPPEAIRARAETAVELEPGQFAQNDIAKRVYRVFRDRFEDTTFVRKVASPDRIQEFLPPGGSRIVEE
jgi:predicted ribosome quality control (RQC) complex YloA/Tae2 family protein